MGALESQNNEKKFVNYGEVPDGEFLRSMEQVIQPHWEEQYLNTPDDNVKLRVDPITGRPFWEIYFEKAVERQNIWHRRVVEKQPKPWTEDEILATYHFVNVDRRDDRLSIYYVDNVLGAFKKNYEQAEDKYESKKFLILNTFIYRLFLRSETWDVIGYIYPESFEEDWERAKENLRERKRSGEPVWTDAYYVNDLKSANPNPETNSDKVENAICLIEWIIDNLDELAEYTFNPENNMESVVKNFTNIPAVGMFNAYEATLDLAIVEEYTGIPFVHFTPDHWPNCGPGCKRGIDYMFEDKGNMSYEDIVFFITSVYRHEFERLGLDYKYPEGRDMHLDLRCWESCFCEFGKYMAAYSTMNGGFDFVKKKRPRKKMKLRTENVDWLKPR